MEMPISMHNAEFTMTIDKLVSNLFCRTVNLWWSSMTGFAQWRTAEFAAEYTFFQLKSANRQNCFSAAGAKLGAPPRGACRAIDRSAKQIVDIGFEFVIEQKFNIVQVE